jgi:adenylate kinase
MSASDVVKAVRNVLPAPRNYGPTEEDKAEEERIRDDRKAANKDEVDRVAAENNAQAFAVHEKNQLAWTEKASEIKRQEAEALQASSIPLRTFLMKHVMPTLTEGLAEVCRSRPDDPVDALAEYLFKNNPRID